MTDQKTLNRAFHAIMTQMVQTGTAPHYAELAKALRCPTEKARQVLHDLMTTGYPGWLHPGTDYIVSFPPFSNLPTQYRISVQGKQRWYAQ